MKRFLPAVLLCIALAAIPSCNVKYFENAEFGDIIFDPSLAIPVGEITYTVSELFEELNDAGADILPNDENVIQLNYQETLQSQSASTFLNIRDQSFSGSLAAGVNVSNPPVTTTLNVSELFEFDLTQTSNETYDSIFFSNGQFEFEASSTFDADIDFTATFISLVENDAPLVVTGSLPSGSSGFSQTESLVDYRGLFHLDDQGNPSSNKFLVRIEYTISVTTSSVITSGQRINFDIGVNDAAFERVYGNVGNQSLAVNFQVVNFDFFRNFEAGNIAFADPKITFNFDNSFGFPLGIDFQEVSAIGPEGAIIPLEGDVVNSLQVVDGPTLAQEGQVIRSSIELNKDNSNIDVLLSSQPTKVIIEVEAGANPANVPPVYNFVNDQSILDIGVVVEIPLDINLDQLIAEEQLDFNNSEDLDEAKRILFRINAENELPLGGLVELQFLDDQDNVVYTIDQRAAFDAAPVGVDGRTTEAALSTADIQLEEEDIRAIENATSINVVATLTTTDAASNVAVKFFEDYELKFKLSAQADVEVNSGSN
ncbi:hypothetical protein [Roseivirga misakiensis]|uniref:Uncharacterized protein n=1 Tax=Roseivirga misakiensis TaxID=1563681 RepID=A0A1E5T1K8_9BACT|nr:hypothetical protein [Roseivirga misakiensis]OEK05263.1 hypothetical protein BFP71_17845 [Roseivirga misakiensis]